MNKPPSSMLTVNGDTETLRRVARRLEEEGLSVSLAPAENGPQSSVDGLNFCILADNLLVCIVIVNSQGLCTYANQHMLRSSGYSMEELTGAYFADFLSEESRQTGLEIFSRRQHGEDAPDQHELSCICKDGSVRTCEVHASLFMDNTGNRYTLIQIFDITEFKATKDALKKSEDLYRLITENMHDILYLYDMDMNVVYVSPSVVRKRGFTLEEYRHLPLEKVLAPGSLEVVQHALAALLKPERLNDKNLAITETFEAEVCNKDGSTTWNEFTNTVIRDGEGASIGILSVGRDITERRKAEQSLKESEEKYRFIADNMTDALWLYDMDMNITYVTPSFTRMRGFSLEQARKLRLDELIAPGSLPQVLTYFDEELTPENLSQKDLNITKTMDLELINKDGSTIWNEITQSVIRDKDGNPVGFIDIGRDITERRKIQIELRKSEGKYRSILENIEEIYLELDLEGNIAFFNAQLEEKSGYGFNELNGRNIGAFCIPEAFEDLQAHFAQVLLTGKSITGTNLVFICKNGWGIPLEISLSLIRSPSGEAVGFRGIARDITERLEVEKALLESQENYRQLVENINDIIYSVDLAGIFTYVSPVVEQITQYTVEECLGQPFTKFIYPEDLPELQARIHKNFQSNRNEPMECRVINKNGEIRYVRTSTRFLYDDTNKIIGLNGLMSDITNHKMTEEALRKSEEKYRTILESMNDSYYETDLTGVFTFCNPGMPRMSGYDYDEIIGYSYAKFTSEEDRKVVTNAYQEVFFSGEPKAGVEWTFIKKNEERMTIETSIALVRDAGGKPVGFCGVARDISERRRTQEAEIANQAKSQFLAHMSHEIRTPMNGIIGMTGLLLDTVLDAEQREYAETVWNSAEILLSIVNDILDFSKIEAGKLDLETMDFNVQILIEDIIDMLAFRAQEKKLNITAIIEPDVPVLLRGDPGRLRQVASNLMSNAIKFTEKGEVVMRVSLVAKDEETAQLYFSIKDSGIGIPQEKRSSLFTPFHQVEASTSRKYGGSGLGLSICKNLTEIMGGKIGMESSIGVGSTFWFTLPFFRQHPGNQPAAPPENIRGVKILLADTVAAGLESMAIMLNTAGCRIDEARNIDDVLDLLSRARETGEHYQIIIMNLEILEDLPQSLQKAPTLREPLMQARTILLTPLGLNFDEIIDQYEFIHLVLNEPVKMSALYAGAVHVLDPDTSNFSAALKNQSQLPASTFRHARPLRILVAEDNIVNQKVALRMLEKMSYRADAVANGAEVVQALERIPYDIVLMDVQMPEMDGFEATKIIRDPQSNVLNHEIPIIALTAHAIKGYMEKCMEAGMNDYITKPVQSQELAQAIEEWAPQSHADQEDDDWPTGSGLPVFERGSFLERLSGDAEAMREILQIFLESAQTHITAISDALNREDPDEAYHVAHTLKGASGNISGLALQAVAFGLEKAGRNGDLESCRALFEKLVHEFNRLQTVLNKELGETKAT